MAEAVADGTPMSRFFCHKCSIEIERLLPDYTCPRCATGFVEELHNEGNDIDSAMDHSSEDLRESDADILPPDFTLRRFAPHRDLLRAIFGEPRGELRLDAPIRIGGPNRASTLSILRLLTLRNLRDTRRSHSNIRGRQGTDLAPMEQFVQDFLLNISTADLGRFLEQGGQSRLMFLRDPGDYIWGRDGLDAIVTQLLNQMDGTGPPPLPQTQIDEIPTTTVTQNQVDCKLQCSVCWEDFEVSEPVRQLPCQHLYHAGCIVPWLELHGTCPICRQSLGSQNTAEANQDTVGASLAILFRAANESGSIGTSSTSSSTMSSPGNNSSNS